MSFQRFFSNKFTLLALTFISGLISVYDNVMNVVFYDSLPADELNPVASLIIDEFSVAGLVVAKAIGTILAVALMMTLIKTKYKYVIYPVFVFQASLFYFLTFHTGSYETFFNKDLWNTMKMALEFYNGEHRP